METENEVNLEELGEVYPDVATVLRKVTDMFSQAMRVAGSSTRTSLQIVFGQRWLAAVRNNLDGSAVVDIDAILPIQFLAVAQGLKRGPAGLPPAELALLHTSATQRVLVVGEPPARPGAPELTPDDISSILWAITFIALHEAEHARGGHLLEPAGVAPDCRGEGPFLSDHRDTAQQRRNELFADMGAAKVIAALFADGTIPATQLRIAIRGITMFLMLVAHRERGQSRSTHPGAATRAWAVAWALRDVGANDAWDTVRAAVDEWTTAGWGIELDWKGGIGELDELLPNS